jgi:acyl-coenzyme A synthetase/AMP-(fatty) acid ligase
VESVRLLLAGDDYTIEYVEIPPLATLYPHLGKEATPESFERLPLPDPATYPHDIVFYMHTSGSSSGVPKAVGWTHEFISVGEENGMCSKPCTSQRLKLGADSVRGMRNLDDAVIGTQCLPTGHTFGILSYIMIPLNSGNTAVAFAPTYKGLPTPDAMLRTLRAAKTTVVWVVPLLLEFWAASDDAVDFLASMMMVVSSFH